MLPKTIPRRRQIDSQVVLRTGTPKEVIKEAFNEASISKFDEDWDVYKVHLKEYKKTH